MKSRMSPAVAARLLAGLGLLSACGAASGVNTQIDWLSYAPVLAGNSIPNNLTFFMPGLGNVLVSYNLPAVMTNARNVNSDLFNGTLAVGTNTWSWTNHELFATVFGQGPDPIVPLTWDITYTFPGTVPAGQIYVGVAGLGQTISFGGGESTAQVFQNGTFLGDWSGTGGPWGPTTFTPGGGQFLMEQSLTGPGGLDPWWNTPLGVVQINDPVSSLTFHMSQIRGDGIGVNIGFAVPAPGAAALLGLGGLLAARRRR